MVQLKRLEDAGHPSYACGITCFLPGIANSRKQNVEAYNGCKPKKDSKENASRKHEIDNKPRRVAVKRRNKKTPGGLSAVWGSCKKSGDTYSRTFGTTIGSESLTTVFGMGTGVTFQICSPEKSRGHLFNAGQPELFGWLQEWIR